MHRMVAIIMGINEKYKIEGNTQYFFVFVSYVAHDGIKYKIYEMYIKMCTTRTTNISTIIEIFYMINHSYRICYLMVWYIIKMHENLLITQNV